MSEAREPVWTGYQSIKNKVNKMVANIKSRWSGMSRWSSRFDCSYLLSTNDISQKQKWIKVKVITKT